MRRVLAGIPAVAVLLELVSRLLPLLRLFIYAHAKEGLISYS